MHKSPVSWHLVANAAPGRPLTERDACADLWARLRGEFPRAFSSTLMPSHVHLLPVRGGALAGPEGATLARERLRVALRAWTRVWHPGREIWSVPEEVEPVRDGLHLQRQIRYVHLNPCRDRLASDPLEWEWSTHRDLVGAVASPWIDRDAIARLRGVSHARLAVDMHAYISGDPSCAVAGTPGPAAPLKPGQLIVPSEHLVRASAMALRAPLADTRARKPARRLAIHLAERLGGLPEVLPSLKISRSGAFRALQEPVSPGALEAALALLAEPRYWRNNSPK